jgi:hypothetical protein
LIPPPVEPADALTQDRKTSHIDAKLGHKVQSKVENPVVVAKEIT